MIINALDEEVTLDGPNLEFGSPMLKLGTPALYASCPYLCGMSLAASLLLNRLFCSHCEMKDRGLFSGPSRNAIENSAGRD